MKNIIPFIIIISVAFGCEKENKDDFIFNPKEQIDGFYTSDIDLFWQVYDYISPNYSKDKFQKYYINNGTVGLNDYASQKQLADGRFILYILRLNKLECLMNCWQQC